MNRKYTPEDLRGVADAAERVINVLVEELGDGSDTYTEVGSTVLSVGMYVPSLEISFTLEDQGDAWYAIELED